MDGSLNMLLICSLVAHGNDETCVFLSNFCVAVSRTGVRGAAVPAASPASPGSAARWDRALPFPVAHASLRSY